jgi:hypothetical protein
MRKSWLTWFGLGAACAVCCAPLLAPILAGAGVAGIGAAGASFSLFGLGLEETICVAVIAAAITSIGAFLLLRHNAPRRAAETCGCAVPGDGAQCDIHGACAPSPRTTPS